MKKNVIKLHRPLSREQEYLDRMASLTKKWHEDHPGHEFKHLFQDIGWLREQGLEIEWDGRCYIMTSDFPYEDSKEHFVIIPKFGIGIFSWRGDYLPINSEWVEEYGMLEEHAWDSARSIIKRFDRNYYSFNKKNTGTIDYPHWHLVFPK